MWSLDQACDAVAGLDIYNSREHFFVFSDAVIRYTQSTSRGRWGIDVLSLWTRTEIQEYLKRVLGAHPGLNGDMAVIVAANGLWEAVVNAARWRAARLAGQPP